VGFVAHKAIPNNHNNTHRRDFLLHLRWWELQFPIAKYATPYSHITPIATDFCLVQAVRTTLSYLKSACSHNTQPTQHHNHQKSRILCDTTRRKLHTTPMKWNQEQPATGERKNEMRRQNREYTHQDSSQSLGKTRISSWCPSMWLQSCGLLVQPFHQASELRKWYPVRKPRTWPARGSARYAHIPAPAKILHLRDWLHPAPWEATRQWAESIPQLNQTKHTVHPL
jgi:hypothetical protein